MRPPVGRDFCHRDRGPWAWGGRRAPIAVSRRRIPTSEAQKQWGPRDPPPPGGVDISADPHPGALTKFDGVVRGLEPPAGRRCGVGVDEFHRIPRLLEGCSQGRAHISRSAGETVLGDPSAAKASIFLAGDHSSAAQQDRRGHTVGGADEVHAAMHAIGQVHVDV